MIYGIRLLADFLLGFYDVLYFLWRICLYTSPKSIIPELKNLRTKQHCLLPGLFMWAPFWEYNNKNESWKYLYGIVTSICLLSYQNSNTGIKINANWKTDLMNVSILMNSSMLLSICLLILPKLIIPKLKNKPYKTTLFAFRSLCGYLFVENYNNINKNWKYFNGVATSVC